MPKEPLGGNDTSSDVIIFPPEHIRETAAKVLAQVSYSQSQHDAAWQQIQSYVLNTFEPAMQGTVMDLLKPYIARLDAAYNWQIDMASALFDAVNAVESTDNGMAHMFTPGGHGNVP
ncbi:MAG: hypothetical protein M3Z08_02815 [Chloroflexota bacterium]|nr:hypothetical protein [Chloroflexota bacterium]